MPGSLTTQVYHRAVASLFDGPGHRLQIFLLDGTGEAEQVLSRHPVGRGRKRRYGREDVKLLVFGKTRELLQYLFFEHVAHSSVSSTRTSEPTRLSGPPTRAKPKTGPSASSLVRSTISEAKLPISMPTGTPSPSTSITMSRLPQPTTSCVPPGLRFLPGFSSMYSESVSG